MANMVNRTWALAAEQTQEGLTKFLFEVFRGQFPKQTDAELRRTVDDIAERMGSCAR